MKERRYVSNKAGECPVCGSENLRYGYGELNEGGVSYDYTCEDCKTEGIEWYSLTFDTHAVMVDEEDELGRVFYSYDFIDENR